ncbi:hypothetical protein ALC57_10798 [Trachymyrmex cornetzi]|uniref:Uncharacterized protein n=1 Tax=Trachymyrmex cornetzi TaxID=471704 RepID=A0A151J3A8_9HYME|nr:hypothetical protein ALC57_10798 [Trachymyrmex cornetzi]
MLVRLQVVSSTAVGWRVGGRRGGGQKWVAQAGWEQWCVGGSKSTSADKQAVDQTDCPSFTFRPALPCVTFRDAGLKLTSTAPPSLRYHAAGGRLAHERARIIQREQPEIHLHLHPSRNLGTMGCIGPLPTCRPY